MANWYGNELYINVYNSYFGDVKWVYIRKGYESVELKWDRRNGFTWDDAKRPQLEANNKSGTKEQALQMAEQLNKLNYGPYPQWIMARVRELLA